MTQNRTNFGSRFGIIMAAAGSAVGLGNIWRFPVETGNNGGAAFLLVYILSVAVLGIPLMVAEFFVGRYAHSNTATAYRKLSKSAFWGNLGFISVIGATLILSYYIVVAGWVLKYMIYSANGTLSAIFNASDASNYTALFNGFASDVWSPIICMVFFILMSHCSIILGVQKGIEKFSKIFMPMLFVILIVLVAFSLFTPGAKDGLYFLFHPDFSKLNSQSILSAVGQSFYSLSLCMGCLCTYASYFSKKVNIVNTAVSISLIDSIVAIMAGIIIFPAVFSSNIDPQTGPSLVFIALPSAFHQAFGNWPIISYIVSTLFYVLLVLATLTSAISLHEVPTAYISEAWNVKRTHAATIVTVICCLLGILCSLSMGILSDVTLFDKNIFELFDYTTTTLMLPLCGILITVFIGWKVNKYLIVSELTNNTYKNTAVVNIIVWILKYVAPLLLIVTFLNGLGLFEF
ncbi:MAG: sodium-dependent transporter [Bacteroidaceae bacterium]|nr:sodium-dependent transporter [Prevotellaceae bacterium]MDY2849213.1 sodium-dependent transporter [Bacteroidaceae bacterium]